MVSKQIVTFIILLSFLSCKDGLAPNKNKIIPKELKNEIISELKEMERLDQRNRYFLAVGTFNRELIDSVLKLSSEEYFKFSRLFESELSKEQEDSLWRIQDEIDLRNTNRLYELIENYGWLNEARLDSAINPLIFLYHTPKETISKMEKLLFNEVKKGRMDAIHYATYVDNMRIKHFRIEQLYGTNKEFDPEIKSMSSPIISNIDSTNLLRSEIGLPPLLKGEYRIKK